MKDVKASQKSALVDDHPKLRPLEDHSKSALIEMLQKSDFALQHNEKDASKSALKNMMMEVRPTLQQVRSMS